MPDILGASTAVLSPYPSSNALVRVSYITVDSHGVATVSWSQSTNGTALTTGAVVTLAALSPCLTLVVPQLRAATGPREALRTQPPPQLARAAAGRRDPQHQVPGVLIGLADHPGGGGLAGAGEGLDDVDAAPAACDRAHH